MPRYHTLVLTSILASLVACSNQDQSPRATSTLQKPAPTAAETPADQDRIKGRWRRSDGGEIAEFLRDGTVTRRVILRPGSNYTIGETYAFPEPGKLRLEQMGSPRTFDYELVGDTLRLTNLEGQSVTYLRVPTPS